MKKIIVFVALCLALPVGSVSAASSYSSSRVVTNDETTIVTKSSVVNSDQARADRQQQQADFEQNQAARIASQEAVRAQRTAELCNSVQTRLQAHQHRYDENGESYISRIRHVEDILETVIARFETTDVDVSELAMMLQQLHTNANAFESRIQAHVASLEDIGQAACNGEEAQYRTMMTENRSEFESLMVEGSSIKDYIENTIRPELEALKLRVADQSNNPAIAE